MSLRQKTVHGLVWTFAQQFSVQLVNFVVQIILARILLPSDYGLIGMITLFIAVGNILMDSGLTSSLIRTVNAEPEDYSAVFVMNLAGSLLIYLVLFLSAPLIANFYRQPLLTSLLRVYTLSFVIQAFAAVQLTRLTKQMNFKLQLILQLPASIIGSVIGITLAYKGFGVWSIVYMNLFQVFIATTLVWVFSGWRPMLVFDAKRLLRHFRFGYKLTLAGVLDTTFDNIYNVVIGRFFTPAMLGYYNRAYSLQMFPVINISTALNKVSFPLFSSVQNDSEKLKMVYKKLLEQVVFGVTPVMVLLVLVAKPLFLVLLTAKWLPAVKYFQILCIAGILYPLHLYNLNILVVKGRSDLYFRLEVIKKALCALGIAIALNFGIMGLVVFQLIFSVITFFINSWYSGKMIGYYVGEQLGDIYPVFLLAIAAAAIGWSLNFYLEGLQTIPSIVELIVVSPAFILAYLAGAVIFKVESFSDLRLLLKGGGIYG